jgi:hypothetical protein
VFGRDDTSDLVEVLFEELFQLEHRSRARDGRRFAPLGERCVRGLDGGVDFGLRAERCPRNHLAARRVMDRDEVCCR